MKKLLMLTAVWMLTASAVGCFWSNAWGLGYPRQTAGSSPYLYNYEYKCCDPSVLTAAPSCTCP